MPKTKFDKWVVVLALGVLMGAGGTVALGYARWPVGAVCWLVLIAGLVIGAGAQRRTDDRRWKAFLSYPCAYCETVEELRRENREMRRELARRAGPASVIGTLRGDVGGGEGA